MLPKATTSLKSQKPIFAAGVRHIYLWPEATSLYKSYFPTKIGMYGQFMLGLVVDMHCNYPAFFCSRAILTKDSSDCCTNEILNTILPKLIFWNMIYNSLNLLIKDFLAVILYAILNYTLLFHMALSLKNAGY